MKREKIVTNVTLTTGPTGGITYSGLTQMLLYLTPLNLLLICLLKGRVEGLILNFTIKHDQKFYGLFVLIK